MIFGILKEVDKRVSIAPEVITQLQGMGLEVVMVKEAGEDAGFLDEEYKKHKVKIVTKADLLSSADVIATFNPLAMADQVKCKEKVILLSRYAPFDNPTKVPTWAKKKHTIYSLDMIPRITVAQSSDVLSSLASIAGYKAVLLATEYLQRYFPMLTTAAGSIPPSKVLVIGAGVAGLQAIATAKRLGAVVEAFDTRAAAKDEVMSLGAKFVSVEGATDDKAAGGYAVEQTEEYKNKQAEAIAGSVHKSDVVISTAQLRGKPAPTLITKSMVENMRQGSVIVDLASSTGGNCEVTKDKKVLVHSGVTVIGDSDLSEKVSAHASLLYGKNILNFLHFMTNEEGKLDPANTSHEVLEKSCIIQNGKEK